MSNSAASGTIRQRAAIRQRLPGRHAGAIDLGEFHLRHRCRAPHACALGLAQQLFLARRGSQRGCIDRHPHVRAELHERSRQLGHHVGTVFPQDGENLPFLLLDVVLYAGLRRLHSGLEARRVGCHDGERHCLELELGRTGFAFDIGGQSGCHMESATSWRCRLPPTGVVGRALVLLQADGITELVDVALQVTLAVVPPVASGPRCK